MKASFFEKDKMLASFLKKLEKEDEFPSYLNEVNVNTDYNKTFINKFILRFIKHLQKYLKRF